VSVGERVDWNEYKALCDSPHVFTRWMLEQTIELLESEPELAATLARTLEGTEIEKPSDHLGGAQTDMFEVTLSPGDARTLVRVIEESVRHGRTTASTRARGLGGFREAWQEYATYAERATNTQRGDPT